MINSNFTNFIIILYINRHSVYIEKNTMMKYTLYMFKKSFSVLFLVYIILLCSCSNTQVSLSPIIINETLRNQIAVNQETIEWTKEIDGHILYEGKKEKIDKKDSA